MGMRNTGNYLNARVTEAWINETLNEAEQLEIPGVIVKPQQKQPLQRYFIDRLNLHMVNLDDTAIDRIYRSLFVYSVGFYEMLNKSLQHAKNKYTLLSSVWMVYSILLEYCCQSNYKMMIAQVRGQHDQELEDMKVGQQQEIDNLRRHEEELTKANDELQREVMDLRTRLDAEVFLRIKLQEEILTNIKN